MTLRWRSAGAAPIGMLLLVGALSVGQPSASTSSHPGVFERGACAQDAWEAARQLPDGPERTAAIVASLAEDTWATLPVTARGERLEVAYRAFLGAEARFAGDEMLGLAEAMHARDRAIWSAFCLEGALRRGFGRYGDAEGVLEALQREYEAAGDPAQRGEAVRALVERRALVAAGAGEREHEAALLGRALGAGSADARQILGFAALRAGDVRGALAHFEVLLAGAPSVEQAPTPARDLPPWALRGYGVALLPRASD